MAVQLIKDDEGNPQYVVIPYNEYFQMRLKMAEYDDEKEEEWEDVPYESLNTTIFPYLTASATSWIKRKSACRRPGAFCAACRSRRWPISSELASLRFPS